MIRMNTSQLREMSSEKIQQEILQKTQELFKIRMRCYAGVEQRTHLLKEARRCIARMKTIFNQKVLHDTKS